MTTQNYALSEIVLESANLVGATCIGINSQKRFANLEFDVTIIDEAGQIQIHNALVPMSVSNKLIMLGDHNQIPPIAEQKLVEKCEEMGIDTELLHKSLFEKMYHEVPESNKIMLDTQYRMPAEIADTISEWFYYSQYFSPAFKRDAKGAMQLLSDKPFIIIDTSFERNRFETRIEDAGSNNNLEADIVVDLLSSIIADNKTKISEIGIISAYKSQVKLIKDKLVNVVDRQIVNEMVATLDSFQGQERDIIIYSFTKSSKNSPNNRRIGFLNELRRLNVAMTRPKRTLILIGDMQFLSSCEHMELNDDGDNIYEKSEKEFSKFITKMIQDVQNGRGDIISYEKFHKLIRGGGNRGGQ
jgi:superfamily I DNA and/or RNA helicase